MAFPQLPFLADVGVFVLAAAVIAFAGTRLAGAADRIADRTGLGEALTGVLFLGFITALPGIAASVTAALEGRPAIAIGNAIGGIAIQTVALAIADLGYRRANLEHAAASVTTILQTGVLIGLLTLVLLIMGGPDVAVLGFNPGTPLLFLAAAGGFVLVQRAREHPMWEPRMTRETVQDEPEPGARGEPIGALVLEVALTAVAVLAAGAAVAATTGQIASATGLNGTVAGGLFTAVATSLPEIVTSTAAVRRGALTLAVSDIVGGNFFDVLFVALADFVYVRGSLYHARGIGTREVFLTGLTILLNTIVLLGLVSRQRRGPARIGFESLLMLLVYVGGFLVLTFAM